MFELLSAVLAVVILLFIAFPKRMMPSPDARKRKRVGSEYWGVYEASHRRHGEGSIEVPKPTRKIHVVAGSQMYAGGNGRGR